MRAHFPPPAGRPAQLGGAAAALCAAAIAARAATVGPDVSHLLMVAAAVLLVALGAAVWFTPWISAAGRRSLLVVPLAAGAMAAGIAAAEGDPWVTGACGAVLLAWLGAAHGPGWPALAAVPVGAAMAVPVAATGGDGRAVSGAVLAAIVATAAGELVGLVSSDRVREEGRQRLRVSRMRRLLDAADVLVALHPGSEAETTIAGLAAKLLGAQDAVVVTETGGGGPSIGARWNNDEDVQVDQARIQLTKRTTSGTVLSSSMTNLGFAGPDELLALPLPTAAARTVLVLRYPEGAPPDAEAEELTEGFARQAARAFDRMQGLRRIADAALRDELTGLANRRALEAILNQLRPGDAVALLDLDRFKSVNDADGHEAGDALLRRLGRFLQAATRADTEIAGRWGGDEFLLILRGAMDQAADRLEELRVGWVSTVPRTTFSAGLAITASGVRPDQLLREADSALYDAKAEGRNTVRCHVLSQSAHQRATAT